ncbi:hypothetical protein GJ699_02455 [Duganella sp. FT80W]|uniref:Uncharacterized protein n=1 Tax=Duganella guangzhouensis TaxID=2666084 RepID=A0A6I2KU13_9BURK|nr:hypothetical protein [Duganella guangzhouensis]MRW88840.1 hypothetical protein [Duganella guangzhouensis]
MIYDLSRAERQHRAIQKEKPGPVLESKQCPCGKNITARQLAQYGKCEHCRLTAGLEEGDLDKLLHMLGAAGNSAAKPGFRNHYLCNVQDRAAMERLVAAGLALAGEQLLQTQYYHATRDGCRAAGLDRSGIARALGAVL